MAVAPFVGIVGYRRSRRNILGMQARMVTVRDGVLRVVDKDDAQIEQVTLAGAAVELKRGMVQVVDGENAFFVYGLAGSNKVPDELTELATRQEAEIAMGRATTCRCSKASMPPSAAGPVRPAAPGGRARAVGVGGGPPPERRAEGGRPTSYA